MKYTAHVPPTKDQGSFHTIAERTYMESMRANALWHYNRARAHDGQPPLTRMPAGTTYTPHR